MVIVGKSTMRLGMASAALRIFFRNSFLLIDEKRFTMNDLILLLNGLRNLFMPMFLSRDTTNAIFPHDYFHAATKLPRIV